MADYLKLINEQSHLDLEDLALKLEELTNSNMIYKYPSPDGRQLLLCLERYFMRVRSFGALTVFITREEGVWAARLIGSGAGEGFSGIDLGASESYVRDARDCLERIGFHEEKQTPPEPPKKAPEEDSSLQKLRWADF